jgi:hypothetical protein
MLGPPNKTAVSLVQRPHTRSIAVPDSSTDIDQDDMKHLHGEEVHDAGNPGDLDMEEHEDRDTSDIFLQLE